jgi:hypothetical protein
MLGVLANLPRCSVTAIPRGLVQMQTRKWTQLQSIQRNSRDEPEKPYSVVTLTNQIRDLMPKVLYVSDVLTCSQWACKRGAVSPSLLGVHNRCYPVPQSCLASRNSVLMHVVSLCDCLSSLGVPIGCQSGLSPTVRH